MELLVKDTLEIIELEIISPTMEDWTEEFLNVQNSPDVYQYSDDWERDCPGYDSHAKLWPNQGYIISQATADYWTERLPLWQTVYDLEYALPDDIRADLHDEANLDGGGGKAPPNCNDISRNWSGL